MTTKGNVAPLHIKTPLLESIPLGQLLNCKVYLKLDSNQPSGSFKIRGIGHIIQKAIAAGCNRLVASSGGNAGIAAAYAARKMNVPITIYVPESTSPMLRKRVEAEGAKVVVHGAVWDIADSRAQKDGREPGCAYIPPFDHPDIWEGHASMIPEIAADLPEPPDLVVVSVGGGGLLCGVVEGMEAQGWGQIPVLAMETIGADSYYQAVKAGKLVTLPDITSVAKCLGALTVCQKSFDYSNQRPILAEVIEDRECIDATLRFLDDHRILVEPACSAALSAIYSGTIQRLLADKKLTKLDSVVVVVCGGNGVNLEQIQAWKQQFNL